ncbi:MAG: Ku protein [Eubacteriaceae bacterium]|nr:Ku protein [Eubacteriaceae bacterium]
MAVAHKGAISFGLVNIPVALYTATKDNDIHFNQLHEEDNSRIRYKKVCSHCNKEVTENQIVKGFEYDKDKFVIVTDEDLEKIKTEKDRSLEILLFTDKGNIKPIYYSRSYHALPQTGGEKAFELLRKAMLKKKKVAVGKTVIASKETLLAIIPNEEGLVVQTMYFEEELKEIPKQFPRPDVDEQELKMAEKLIGSMEKAFEPEKYRDEYQTRLRELIQNKIEGKQIVTPEEKEQTAVTDLMEALKQSIEKEKKRAV